MQDFKKSQKSGAKIDTGDAVNYIDVLGAGITTDAGTIGALVTGTTVSNAVTRFGNANVWSVFCGT
ncbi:MAG: hypothetical protein LE178_03845 [Endomicrobium sp.]|nr:hypothetical protein [Endomicrobium sp.]